MMRMTNLKLGKNEMIEAFPMSEEMSDFKSLLRGHESATTNDLQIQASFPGVVTLLRVKPGDVVEQGHELMVVEAASMRNVFEAPGLARVVNVKVHEGDRVEAGQVMIEFSKDI